jgi:putative sterol carrier protein
LNLTEQHLHKLLVDELNATMAYMTGQVKVDGKIGLALKLQEIVRLYQEIV